MENSCFSQVFERLEVTWFLTTRCVFKFSAILDGNIVCLGTPNVFRQKTLVHDRWFQVWILFQCADQAVNEPVEIALGMIELTDLFNAVQNGGVVLVAKFAANFRQAARGKLLA